MNGVSLPAEGPAVSEFVARNSRALAYLAYAAYRRAGRGAVLISHALPAPARCDLVPRAAAYLSLAEAHGIGEEAARAVASYDPERQFVCCMMGQRQRGTEVTEVFVREAGGVLDGGDCPQAAELAERLTPVWEGRRA